jgi:2-polyprenyl-6-methoxyphenol hydroxylase-like FAD-dependent oxidoreductase
VALKKETDVLVVGAGPVGQLAALHLARRGVDVAILDKHHRTGAHSYALALHSDTLRLLHELGVLDEVAVGAHRIDRVGFYDGATRRCTVEISKLGGDFPYVLVTPQSSLESALESRLVEHGVKVLWNHRLEELLESTLTLEIAKLDRVACGYPIAQMEWVVAKTFHTRASYVVGADGYHSVIRERLGIPLQNLGDPAVYSVFEFDSPTEPDSEVRVVLDDESTSVLWPMADGRCRFSFGIRDVEEHEPSRDFLNARIRERAPWFPKVEGPIHWTSAVIFAKRLAGSFGRGRVWLAGDSAHLTSPVGVQSMNAGLGEARDLADRIADTLGGNGSGSLEEYDRGHRERWRFLLGIDVGPEAGGADAWVRERASRILSSVPATGDDLRRLLAQIGLS